MKRKKMLFKIGVTLIIFVGILLFFIVDVEDDGGGFYQHVPARDAGGGVGYMMEMAMREPLDTTEDEQDSGRGLSENDLDIDVNAQIDAELKELMAHRRKTQGRNDYDEDNDDVNLHVGKEKEDEFYYDNSVPDLDSGRKKVNMFGVGDQNPVLSREFMTPGQMKPKPRVHLCVVVCENRAQEAVTMLKSAAIVSTDVWLIFHIVADKDRQPIIQTELDSWPHDLQQTISYHIYDVAFPQGPVTLTAWNKLYKPCASQRLFLPDRLHSIDSLIYVDTDAVFLQSVGDLWSSFSSFNASQMVGMVRESEDGTAGWYNRFASHPYYGHYGVNSGVMLMNMTRIRDNTAWLSVLQRNYEKYRLSITWGDQDLINIYLATRPEQVYLIPCNWNYRTDHCMYTSNCGPANQKGVSLVHASRGAFHGDREPVFGAVYQAFQQAILGPDTLGGLVMDLESRFKHVASKLSGCSDVSSLFLTQLVRLAMTQRRADPSSRDGSQLQNSHHNFNNHHLIHDPSVQHNAPSPKLVKDSVLRVDKLTDDDVSVNSNIRSVDNINNNINSGVLDRIVDPAVVNFHQDSPPSQNSTKEKNSHTNMKVQVSTKYSNSVGRQHNGTDENVRVKVKVKEAVGEGDIGYEDNGKLKEHGVEYDGQSENDATFDLTTNEIYINNKLKAGKFNNVMGGGLTDGINKNEEVGGGENKDKHVVS